MEFPGSFRADALAYKAGVMGKRDMPTDAYFSVDVETDGPIPGPFSMLSFAIVYAGAYDGVRFLRPANYESFFYRELAPISDSFEVDAMNVNGLNREDLKERGALPSRALADAAEWIAEQSVGRSPVLIAYPLSFDWTWLYWYFIRFNGGKSPFNHSRCFDIKTAFAVKAKLPLSAAGRSQIPTSLRPLRDHTHHAVDDAIEQAEIFANIFEWDVRT